MSPKAKTETKGSSKSAADDDESLKRLPGTGWQTRDGRFTITTASGTWSVTDEEQTDELGLPLVRGPFRSLTDAKTAIESARESAPATSTLTKPAGRAKPAPTEEGERRKAPPKPKLNAVEPEEPRWITELEPADRRRARQLIRRLEERAVRDAEGVVRRDVAGGVPTVARVAVADRVAEALGEDPSPGEVRLAGRLLEALTEGRDDALDVRWKLVDDEGRPVGVSTDDVAAARKRARDTT
ncbi:MAG TPA: hypothetical protein VFV72_11390 [Candidatus Limnocylindrales bacterium]|nr:hypothetical protein [Candidatus Limnocylindrales bacterium]